MRTAKDIVLKRCTRIIEAPPTHTDDASTPAQPNSAALPPHAHGTDEENATLQRDEAGDGDETCDDGNRLEECDAGEGEPRAEANLEQEEPPDGTAQLDSEERERRRRQSLLERDRKNEEKARHMRARITNEILSTETSYVNNLDFLIKNFREPMVSENVASTEEVDAIFSNIILIWNFNKTLLAELQKQFELNEESPELGQVFLEMAPYMKMYTQYVNNYNRSLTTLAACKSRRPFAAWLQQAHTFARTGTTGDLPSYLIQPVQRLPRYILLLQDLLHNTPASHKGYDTLLAALQKVRDVTKDINDMRRYAENMEKVFQVQTKISEMAGLDQVPENLVQPSRVYVREGELMRFDRGRRRKQYLYLFNDILLCVDLEAITFWYPWRIDAMASLFGGKIRDCSADPALQLGLPSAPQREVHAFQIILRSGEIMIFLCTSQEEKESWFSSIHEQIAHLERKHATKQARLQQLSKSLGNTLSNTLSSALSMSSVFSLSSSSNELREEDFEIVNGDMTSPRQSASSSSTLASRPSTRPPPLKEGYLTKQGGIIPSWKRRWFVLQRHRLAYYEDREQTQPRGYIDVRRYKVYRSDLFTNTFELRPDQIGERIYRMTADTTQECDEWLAVLKTVAGEAPRSASQTSTPTTTPTVSDELTSSGLLTQLRARGAPLSFSFLSSFREENRRPSIETDTADGSNKTDERERKAGSPEGPPRTPRGEKNTTLEAEEEAASKAAAAAESDDDGEAEGEWTCPRCTFVNRPSFLVCEVCSEIRDFREEESKRSSRDADEDDSDDRWLTQSAPNLATTAGRISSPAAVEAISMDTDAELNFSRRASNADEAEAEAACPARPTHVKPALLPTIHHKAASPPSPPLLSKPTTPAPTPTVVVVESPSPEEKKPAAEFVDFAQQLSSKRISPLMANSLFHEGQRSRRSKRSPRGAQEGGEGSGGQTGGDKSKTLDVALLARLRSATAPSANPPSSIRERLRSPPPLPPPRSTAKLCAKPAAELVHVWSNRNTVSTGQVTFLNPTAADDDSMCLGFVARPYWFEGVEAGQTISAATLQQAEDGQGSTCPIWNFTENASSLGPSSSTSSRSRSPTSVGEDTQTTSPSSPPPSAHWLVRPQSFRLLWKDTGINSKSRCSIWRPLPPSDDYAAVGFLVTDAYRTPSPEQTNFCCVHKSLLVETSVNPVPVWTNRDSTSHYKLSVWQVNGPTTEPATSTTAAGPTATSETGSSTTVFTLVSFIAVAGHEPPTTPVYTLRPGIILSRAPPPTQAEEADGGAG